MTFYDVLGLHPHCRDDEIKRAFRHLSKTHHPDIPGGDADKFRAIEEAYTVLIDPAARAYYDQHGTAPPVASEVTPNAQLYGLLQQVIDAAIQAIADESSVDLLTKMREIITTHKMQIGVQQRQAADQCKKYTGARARFKRKNGDNLITTLMQTKIDHLQKQIAEYERMIALDDQAIDLLKDYKYKFDRTATAQPVFFTQSGVFGATR